ncbi:hypothetical protein [Priestia endophytica]|uniref:hypothetical protein n=1 Tax=Priestia endophytica TaxID=135735 RepID=UPI000F527D89|nr:hypothetical protein [Priestia endophytica]MED4073447.1 hypothetical protein [Priestia endophytica]
MTFKRLVKRPLKYEITIMQTPNPGDRNGYRQVYKMSLKGHSHSDVISQVFRNFNVSDRLPKDFHARYVGTRDIILIDEGTRGKYYYKLLSGGWKPVQLHSHA